MAIIRIHANRNYEALSIHHLRDTSLSWQAMGMLSFMLSCRDDFKFSIEGLTERSRSGSTATRSALQELKDKHYVVVSPVKVNGRITEWNYDIYECPESKTALVENVSNESVAQNSDEQISVVENTQVENQRQRNTNNKHILIEDPHSFIPPASLDNSSVIPPLPPKRKTALDLSFIAEEYREAYMMWLEYKREKKEMYKTQRSVELNYKHALSLAENNPEVLRLIVEQSIANDWKGLFAIKQNYQPQKPIAYGNQNNRAGNAGTIGPADTTDRRERDYNFEF
ncbi:MAG: hypothetical protein IJ640_00160 [Prevotella sp.]|nr:hypothetical protein [Prevotella sp.]